jgi:hypothetical protein
MSTRIPLDSFGPGELGSWGVFERGTWVVTIHVFRIYMGVFWEQLC